MKMREKGEQRMVTFSKRRKSLFKKAHELHCLIRAHIATLVFSPAGRPYTHGDPSFEATVERYMNMMGTTTYVNKMNGGDGGDDCGAKMTTLRYWLDGIGVEDCYNVEEIVLMKEIMETLRGKVFKQIENEMVESLNCSQILLSSSCLMLLFRVFTSFM